MSGQFRGGHRSIRTGAVLWLVVAVSGLPGLHDDSRCHAAAVAENEARSDQLDEQTVDRLAGLCRVWAEVGLRHPYVTTRGVDWDSALLDVLPLIRAAKSDTEYADAIRTLLAGLDDPATHVLTEQADQQDWAGMVQDIFRGKAATDDTPQPRLDLIDDDACRLVMRDLAQITGAALESNGGATADVLSDRGDRRIVLLDLRTGALPYADELLETAFYWYRREIHAALPALLHRPAYLPTVASRFHSGHPSADGPSSGGYARGSIIAEHPVLRPRRDDALQLVVIMDTHNPVAADVAAALRASGQARVLVVGDPAELRQLAPSTTVTVSDDLVVALRTGVVINPGGARPAADQELPEDATEPDIRAAALDLARRKAAPSNDDSSATVPFDAPRSPAGKQVDASVELDVDMRLLALFRAWSTLDTFFAYKHLADQDWDRTLEEFIPVFVAAEGRNEYVRALRLFLARTNDSHTRLQGAGHVGGDATVAFSVAIVEGQCVVTSEPASELDVQRGDVIVTVDGQPIMDRFEQLAPLIAASTPQSLNLQAARQLLAGPEGTAAEIALRRDDRAWTVSIPRSAAHWPKVRARVGRSPRPVYETLSGDIGYADLDRLTNADIAAMFESFTNLPAIILDLRGYPNGTMRVLARRLAGQPFRAAQFRRPMVQGDSFPASAYYFEQQFGTHNPEPYNGAVVVLINEEAISQAEHTCLVLERATDDITFVGGPTAGANGDVTSVNLPGGLTVWFTGHDVRHADGARLQRVGITPDVTAAPTIEGIRDGRDEVLDAAIDFIAAQRRAADASQP